MKYYSSNKCHTLHRTGCSDDTSYENVRNKKTVDEYHLYYNAVKCANKVLAGDYSKLSFLALAILAFLF